MYISDSKNVIIFMRLYFWYQQNHRTAADSGRSSWTLNRVKVYTGHVVCIFWLNHNNVN